MNNLNVRKRFLNNLFNPKKILPVGLKELKPHLSSFIDSSIKEEKGYWSEVPHYRDKLLDLDTLMKEKQYSWMKQVDMRMYHELIKDNTPEEVATKFIDEAFEKSLSLIDLIPSLPDKLITRRPLISLDLETTGLDLTFEKRGGRTEQVMFITGICIAFCVSPEQEVSIYLPLLHTEKDGVPNLNYSFAIKLLERITNEFSVVYHNASYDREVCSVNGVKINQIGNFFDTLILFKQTDEMLEDYPKLGLKALSEKYLERKQIALNMVADNNDGYHNLAYHDMNLYGHGDASNTLALFIYLVQNEEHIFEKLTLQQIDAKALDVASVFNRRGFPGDKEYIWKSFETTLRRELIIYDKFYAVMEELGLDTDIYITKTEAISRELIKVYIDNFSKFVKTKTGVTFTVNDNVENLARFQDAVLKDLDIEIKTKSLKSGETKLTHSMNVDSLKSIQHNIETVRWMDPQTAEKICELAELLLSISSILQNKNTYYKPMIKGLVSDDSGYFRLPVRLKFCSTITTRFANQSGKPTAMEFTEMKTKNKYSFSMREGLVGINAQGLPSDSYNLKKSKRVLNIEEVSKSISRGLKVKTAEVSDYLSEDLY